MVFRHRQAAWSCCPCTFQLMAGQESVTAWAAHHILSCWYLMRGKLSGRSLGLHLGSVSVTSFRLALRNKDQPNSTQIWTRLHLGREVVPVPVELKGETSGS